MTNNIITIINNGITLKIIVNDIKNYYYKLNITPEYKKFNKCVKYFNNKDQMLDSIFFEVLNFQKTIFNKKY